MDANSRADQAVADLREVAYWMERSRQETRRVEAYRKAADAIASLPAEDLVTLHENGGVQQVPGVGASTGAVITAALEGRVAPKLATLREAGAQPLAASELIRELRGDLHTHSTWSDGGSPIAEMARTAQRLGREYFAITDHSPRLRVANGLSPERLRAQWEEINRVQDQVEVRLLKGIEVDILDDGALDQTPEMLDQLDVVVASVHSKLAMDSESMTRRMVGAVANPRTNVLGHCTGRLVTGGRGQRPESQFDAEVVFQACIQFNVAVEINSRPERQDPPDGLIELARDMGCLFSIDTDAHAPGQLDFLQLGAARAEQLDVDPGRIITTWPLERLLAFTRG
ncbi:PHP domain-containing protein [Aestuariimicrobium sp. p3-SID1156]|uniref:PHP domain-containing protein n=1 Tax=Aestuariimicrobium sp. p3-SID1156 TaxID=2916038 RepID=UPI00223AC2B8|nr:PHP domain-containing protein [Aestuariimicrobium sp. p3-SID1156]MCT1459937.1 PHP domain-containing protein [Aestuariimicrobium sp. p3-SID1156]